MAARKPKTGLPELFVEIMNVQDMIDEVKERMVQMLSRERIEHFETMQRWESLRKGELQPLLNRMAILRAAAQEFLSTKAPVGSGRPVAMRGA